MKKHPIALIVLLAATACARAFEIGCLFPAGGEPGTTFTVSVRGHDLKLANGALISGAGIETALVDFVPATNAPSEKMDNAPLLQEEVIVRMTIDKNAQPGPRDFRLASSNALTAPLVFHVGRYPEVTERDPSPGARQGMAIESLPVCINGRLTENSKDSFRFKAAKGQTLVAQMEGRALNPFIVDIDPGWFQPVLTLLDAQGKEAATCDRFRFDTDPILVFSVPATGDYTLQVRDALNRGRIDFVYRLTVGELPLVTGFFPMGGRKGYNLNITREGVNLPPQKIRIFSGGKTPESCLQALVGDGLAFPALRFDLDTLPEKTASEPGDGAQAEQTVSLPIIINGTVNKPKDVDAYRFEGKAGQEVAIETRACQLGSPLDTLITLADSAGHILATHDDQTNVFTSLLTENRDSAILTRLPADGTYEVRITDAHGNGGPDYHYRLRISEPRPDFELWVTPSSLTIPLGGTVHADVHVRRIDGFNGPVALQLDNPPIGISCCGSGVPEGKNAAGITLAATASPKRLPRAPFELDLSGVATNGDKVIREQAQPAHRKLVGVAHRHLMADQAWMANIGEEAPRSYAPPLIKVGLSEQCPYIKASPAAPFEVTLIGYKTKAIARYLEVKVTEPESGFIVKSVRDGEKTGDIVVTLACAQGNQAPAKTGRMEFSVSRKANKLNKVMNRPTPATYKTPATPYSVE